MGPLGLPFEEVWAVDFEFYAPPGERPRPVCMVARELGSNKLIRLFEPGFPATPPFRTDEGVLFIAFSAQAEWGCFLQLGWPLPQRIIDLSAEFRAETNGITLGTRKGLLNALTYHGIAGISKDEKKAGRDLVMTGGPWTADQRAAIVDYCQTDVDPLGALLERMLPMIRARTVKGTSVGLWQALRRGRFTSAVARMEHVGIPIDTATHAQLVERWGDIKLELIRGVDAPFGFYDGTTFKAGRFDAWLADRSMPWPRLDSGHLRLDGDTFRDMVKVWPVLRPIAELRHALNDLRLTSLAVGSDGRNRTPLWPFSATTGRNLPDAAKFIFGPSVWLRGLIKPPSDRAVAYIDWSSQEVWIAASLSGDEALIEALMSGDVYMWFAARAGLAPPGATKATHGAVRDVCKVLVLGIGYGMEAHGLALRTGISMIEAELLLFKFWQTFPTYRRWREAIVNEAKTTGLVQTRYGWPMRTEQATRRRLMNFPCQATGSEILRLGACLATEAGVGVCAPVHDALLIESTISDLDETISTTTAAMTQAARTVIGFDIPVETAIVRHPQRYLDKRDQDAGVWDTVTGIIESLRARTA